MAAHSFGGYLSGHYSLKYPQYVKKLLLISPIGINLRDPNENDYERFVRKSHEVKAAGGSGPNFTAQLWVKAQWSNKSSPFTICRILGKQQTNVIIDEYMSKRQKTGNERLKTEMSDFLYQLLMRPGTSECGFMVIMTQGMQAHLPLGVPEKLGNPECPIPFSMIFGDEDWMR